MIRRIGYGARMNESEKTNHDETSKLGSDCPCFCIKRILCSPNRVSPLPFDPIEETIESPRGLTACHSPTTAVEQPEDMQQKKEKRVKTPRMAQFQSSPTRRKTPVQKSQSSHVFPAVGDEDSKVPRPTTKVMNRHPSAEEIASLPHIGANKALSDLNVSSTKPESQNAGFRLGGKIILPPLTTSRKGADGDTTKHAKQKSLFRKKGDLNKAGDNGSGEKVITFSLPAISTVDSIELRNQNPVVRKGGMAYDLIIPSKNRAHYPGKRLFSPPTRSPEATMEKETELQVKLERAEKRRIAKQDEIKRLRKEREKSVQQNKEEHLGHVNEKARDLEARMTKAAEKSVQQNKEEHLGHVNEKA